MVILFSHNPVGVPNEARMEWLYSVVEGLPKARQKRLIVQAALSEVGFLTPDEAERLLSSLGLEGA
tara:strand:- start:292 stop:489 length:198 start_codon:yes stop_codon:yes gene_type:complete